MGQVLASDIACRAGHTHVRTPGELLRHRPQRRRRAGGSGARLEDRRRPLPQLGGQRQRLRDPRRDRDHDDLRQVGGGDAAHPVHPGHGEEARKLPRWPRGHRVDVPLHGKLRCPPQSLCRHASRLPCFRMPQKLRASHMRDRDTSRAYLAGGERARLKNRLQAGNGRNDT